MHRYVEDASGPDRSGGVRRDGQRRRDDSGETRQAVQRSMVPRVLSSGGRPLEEPVRAEMEARLGADFSDVRIHTGSSADRPAAEIGARAYTAGHHVVLGDGGSDRHTLAHELTHVIQQRNGPVAGAENVSGLKVSDPDDTFARAAEANAQRVMKASVPISVAPPPEVGRPSARDQAVPSVQRVFEGAWAHEGQEDIQRQLEELGVTASAVRLMRLRAGTKVFRTIDELAAELGGGPVEGTAVADYVRETAAARATSDEQSQEPQRYLRVKAGHPLAAPTPELTAQMAAVLADGDPSGLLPVLIAQLYSVLSWTGRAPVTVYTDEAQGRGDLTLGIKTAETLRESFPGPGATGSDVSLMSTVRASTKNPGMFRDSGLPYTLLPDANTEPPTVQNPAQAPVSVVVAPQLGVTKPFQKGLPRWNSQVTTLTEYNNYQPLPPGAVSQMHAAGLGRNRYGVANVGINVDTALREYKKSQDSIPLPEDRRQARLENLHALKDPQMLTGLFSRPIGNREQDIDAYARNAGSRLYFAYSNKSAVRFAMLVASLESEGRDDVTVAQSSVKKDQFGLSALDVPAKQYLIDRKVGIIRLVTFVNGSKQVSNVLLGHGGKTMTWILVDSIPKSDMLTLIRASEPITMMTGNQSTAEALSAGKTILYESIGQPQSQAFRTALLDDAGVGADDRLAIEAMSRDHDWNLHKPTPVSPGAPGPTELDGAAAALRRMEAGQNMPRLSDRVAATRDLGRWIGGSQLRSFLMQGPLKSDLEGLEADLIANAKAPEGEPFRTFLKGLTGLAGS
ncbi:hypothetical protein GCM10022223_17240 [Kineosporia mesophila]|uniref:eCIS core domain-containing protein n=1 Tax=Kineosporia mesophila TaxID=566012 RepID=A0ABP6Z967_9ACTN|nr:DUF4157 domain-containing protein [Kineosporia mesophila]MCD5352037.1 DUF4157 domain-containing protein [Kineosporia mesophila]